MLFDDFEHFNSDFVIRCVDKNRKIIYELVLRKKLIFSKKSANLVYN